MKQEFIEYLNALMAAAPHIEASENVKAYIEALQETKTEKPVITDNGKMILKFLQDNTDRTMYKARDIADDLGISSRGVSGSLRKLVSDGFVEKVGESPAIYMITEKGKNFIIEE
jgi:DNA-binding MarR family transcriptional regulator